MAAKRTAKQIAAQKKAALASAAARRGKKAGGRESIGTLAKRSQKGPQPKPNAWATPENEAKWKDEDARLQALGEKARVARVKREQAARERSSGKGSSSKTPSFSQGRPMTNMSMGDRARLSSKRIAEGWSRGKPSSAPVWTSKLSDNALEQSIRDARKGIEGTKANPEGRSLSGQANTAHKENLRDLQAEKRLRQKRRQSTVFGARRF